MMPRKSILLASSQQHRQHHLCREYREVTFYNKALVRLIPARTDWTKEQHQLLWIDDDELSRIQKRTLSSINAMRQQPIGGANNDENTSILDEGNDDSFRGLEHLRSQDHYDAQLRQRLFLCKAVKLKQRRDADGCIINEDEIARISSTLSERAAKIARARGIMDEVAAASEESLQNDISKLLLDCRRQKNHHPSQQAPKKEVTSGDTTAASFASGRRDATKSNRRQVASRCA